MDPTLRMKIAEFLDTQQVFAKGAGASDIFRGGAGRLKSLALANRGKLGLLGGAGAAGGIASLGKKEQGTQQEAAELNQLLEAYPELLYETPPVAYSQEGQQPHAGGGMYADQYPGY